MFNKTLHLHFIKLMYNTSVKSKKVMTKGGKVNE